MIKEKTLKQGKNYKFKHLSIDVMEKDESNNVLVFRATYIKTKRPDQFMSDGLIEINRTLWDQDSKKRPKGYWVIGGHQGADGICTSYLCAEEWLNAVSKEYRNQKDQEWKIGVDESEL
jgi:hypothetical protein